MTKLVVTMILTAFPTYFYAWLVRRIDRFEKEPVGYLIGAFLWGAIPSIVLGIVFQLFLDIQIDRTLGRDSLQGEFAMMAITAPVTEEILKGMAVAIIYFTCRREFDGWVDGIVYGATAGFGFAYVENILYIMGTQSIGEWVTLFFLRVLVLGFMHGFWSALTGIGFGLARHMHNSVNKVLAIAGGLVAAIFAHLVHNGAIVLIEKTHGASLLIGILNYLLLGAIMIGLNSVAAANDRKNLKQYLADEVPHCLRPEDYEALCSLNMKSMLRQRMTDQQRRKLVQIAAELAQKKLQLLKMGEEGGNSREIEQLQAQLQKISWEGS